MPKESAGLLMYKKENNIFYYFLAHPGGPFWKNKDEGAWTIPKGEIEEAEEKLEAAKREFKEETGIKAQGSFIDLGSIKQKSGKIVYCWAFEGDFSGLLLGQSIVKMEFPQGSGKFITFPEIDKAEMFTIEEAKIKINQAQFEFIERLEKSMAIGILPSTR